VPPFIAVEPPTSLPMNTGIATLPTEKRAAVKPLMCPHGAAVEGIASMVLSFFDEDDRKSPVCELAAHAAAARARSNDDDVAFEIALRPF
jgi:hypothetical protein